MRTTRRRYWVFFLLFLFNLIAYVDRVNMSVAGKPIAQEFGLSPVALGYLFSSFLWAYVLMMLPGGRLIDRWGAHVVASLATAVWSAAQMATGVASSFTTMLLTRLGLGIGEAPFAPVTYRSARTWALYRARHGHRCDLGRLQPRTRTWCAVCGLADRRSVMALVVHYHRRHRLRLGRALVGGGFDPGKDPMAAAGGAAAHFRRA